MKNKTLEQILKELAIVAVSGALIWSIVNYKGCTELIKNEGYNIVNNIQKEINYSLKIK